MPHYTLTSWNNANPERFEHDMERDAIARAAERAADEGAVVKLTDDTSGMLCRVDPTTGRASRWDFAGPATGKEAAQDADDEIDDRRA